MIYKNLYQELCEEIDTLEWRIEELEKEYKFWWSNCFGAGKAPLDICLNRMKEICDLVDMYSQALSQKIRSKREFEQRLSKLEGVEGKVMYKRMVEGKSLQEIAHELNYSLDWIKKVSSRVKLPRAV